MVPGIQESEFLHGGRSINAQTFGKKMQLFCLHLYSNSFLIFLKAEICILSSGSVTQILPSEANLS